MGRRTAVVDASVLIAILNRGDLHHAEALRAVDEARGHSELALPMIAYAETWVGVARLKPARREAIAAHVRELMRIEPMTASIAQRGAALRARTGATLADALVVATGQEIDASVILTADARWKELDRRVMVVAQEP